MILRSLLLAFACVAAVAVAQEPEMSSDEHSIRAEMMKLEEGWNSGSGAKFAEPFSKDADYVVVSGVKIKGHEVIKTAHQQIFDTLYKGTKLKLKIEGVRMLRPDVAVSHGYAVRDNVDGSKDHARMSITWLKTDGKWQIEAFHNTPVLRPEM
jgi:uncharacterized protein (TIGR02246 family)